MTGASNICTNPATTWTGADVLTAVREAMAKIPKWSGPNGCVLFPEDVARLRQMLPPAPSSLYADRLFGLPVHEVASVKEAAELIWHFGLRRQRMEPFGRLALEFAAMEMYR